MGGWSPAVDCCPPSSNPLPGRGSYISTLAVRHLAERIIFPCFTDNRFVHVAWFGHWTQQKWYMRHLIFKSFWVLLSPLALFPRSWGWWVGARGGLRKASRISKWDDVGSQPKSCRRRIYGNTKRTFAIASHQSVGVASLSQSYPQKADPSSTHHWAMCDKYAKNDQGCSAILYS